MLKSHAYVMVVGGGRCLSGILCFSALQSDNHRMHHLSYDVYVEKLANFPNASYLKKKPHRCYHEGQLLVLNNARVRPNFLIFFGNFNVARCTLRGLIIEDLKLFSPHFIFLTKRILPAINSLYVLRCSVICACEIPLKIYGQ